MDHENETSRVEDRTDEKAQATAAFAANNTDPKTHVVPAVVPSEGSAVGSVILFYDSPDVSYPDALKVFTDIPAVSNTMGFKTVAEMAVEMGAVVTPHIKYVPSCPNPAQTAPLHPIPQP